MSLEVIQSSHATIAIGLLCAREAYCPHNQVLAHAPHFACDSVASTHLLKFDLTAHCSCALRICALHCEHRAADERAPGALIQRIQMNRKAAQ